MRGVVDGGVLDTQAGQVGDGEEATVVLIGVRPACTDQLIVLAVVHRGRCIPRLHAARRQRVPMPAVVQLVSVEREISIGLEVVRQHGDQHAPVTEVPVDVEPRRALCCGPETEELPPGVVLGRIGHPHVVGHDVDHQGQPGPSARHAERLQPILPAPVRVHHRMVHDVIAVLGAGQCPQQRGDVKGIDAQL